jgi:cytochrome c
MKKENTKMTKTTVLAVLVLLTSTSVSHADGDAAKGEKIYVKCKTCHDIDKGVNKVGPSLKGLIGRKAAAVPDFKYSEAMIAKGAEGVVWDEATLTVYLPDPKAFVPKTKMVFAGLKKSEDIEDLIAFLKTKP